MPSLPTRPLSRRTKQEDKGASRPRRRKLYSAMPLSKRAASRRNKGTTRAKSRVGVGSLSVRGRCTGTAPARAWVGGEALRLASLLGCKAGTAEPRKGTGDREAAQLAALRPLIRKLPQGALSPRRGRGPPVGALALFLSLAPPAPPLRVSGWAVRWGPSLPSLCPPRPMFPLSSLPHHCCRGNFLFRLQRGPTGRSMPHRVSCSPPRAPASCLGRAVATVVASDFLDWSLPEEAESILSLATGSRHVLAELRSHRREALCVTRWWKRYLAWDGVSPRQ